MRQASLWSWTVRPDSAARRAKGAAHSSADATGAAAGVGCSLRPPRRGVRPHRPRPQRGLAHRPDHLHERSRGDTVTARTKDERPTTQARLQSVINLSRNTMRKDAGLNGELDRLPQLAWLLFLKAFDDLEEERAIVERDYRPVLEEQYRWRDWASGKDLTGEPLLRFVNTELLPTLRGLQGTGKAGDPRDTLARVFQDTANKMLSGHLLRQLVDQLDKITFSSSDDMHTMAVFYESMLREMRDAAGDSGECYTRRPLIRLIVEQVGPRPGEKVLDPAGGPPARR